MELSFFLAKLLGITLSIVSLGVLINQKFYHEMWNQLLKQPFVVIWSGVFDVIAGLLIVLSHNLWIHDWRVVITILGWFLLVRGSLRVLLPEKVLEFADKLIQHHSGVLNTLLVGFLVVGLFLVFKGFGL